MDVLLRNVASVALRDDFAVSIEPLLQFPREPSLHVLRHDVRSQSPDHIKPLKFRGEQPAILVVGSQSQPEVRRIAPQRVAVESGWRHTCDRSEEHTSELQSRENLVCRLLLDIKNR